MQLSIVIVNYKSAQLIINCLASVYQHTNLLFEVIIVDNETGEQSEIYVKQKFPDVKWVKMGYNAGFARANNEGIRKSEASIILLLNPDTIISDRSIELSYKEFFKSDFIACGLQLMNVDGSPQISGNYVIKGALNNFLPLPFLGRLFRILGNFFKVRKTNLPDSNKQVEVDWINGAYIMFKREYIIKAGFFDEDFFLYAEEAEWCSRLKKFGKLCIYGQFKLLHLQGESSNTAYSSSDKGYYNLFDKKGRQLMVSNFVRIRKQFGILWFIFHMMIYTIEIPIFFIGFLILFPFKKRKYSIISVKGYTQNVMYLVSISIFILQNKPHFYKVK